MIAFTPKKTYWCKSTSKASELEFENEGTFFAEPNGKILFLMANPFNSPVKEDYLKTETGSLQTELVQGMN